MKGVQNFGSLNRGLGLADGGVGYGEGAVLAATAHLLWFSVESAPSRLSSVGPLLASCGMPCSLWV